MHHLVNKISKDPILKKNVWLATAYGLYEMGHVPIFGLITATHGNSVRCGALNTIQKLPSTHTSHTIQKPALKKEHRKLNYQLFKHMKDSSHIDVTPGVAHIMHRLDPMLYDS
jgi:hypothetical protein